MADTAAQSPRFVYKLLSSAPPEPLQSSKPLVTALDEQDGFMHLSTALQVPKTLARFYSKDEFIWIVKIPFTGAFLEASKWDASSTGELFPHLYGDVAVDQEKDGWSIRKVKRAADEDWFKALDGASWLEF
ncbi:hypothetical protein AURDEDRAFT_170770 [Auricularia subglabra TFB-10046 SS5]|uniref:DUF952-domain-containing protein n=1 Tax=Auricularia subglabra (strain TFB-10046 / SS5) TaxID=717982 RepID=J0LJL3_AURST|nr:hypothetical protein AURDEDRAFT_170770 [Auricularia subglabra TFB-10046 SS5]